MMLVCLLASLISNAAPPPVQTRTQLLTLNRLASAASSASTAAGRGLLRTLDRPSFRLYGAFDLDVSRDFKILGELFYDPDYFSITRDHPKVGVDVGLMWAYSETLRFLVHLDVPFVGIYWRF